MRFILTALAAAGALSAFTLGAAAQDDLDTDGDGMISMEEMQAAYPDMTEEEFGAIDTSGDGMVDSDEYTAAEEAGTLPQSDG